LNVCLQVNIDSEASKSGVAEEALPALADKVIELPYLKLRGLMCIPSNQTALQQQRRTFAHLAAQLETLRHSTRLARLDTLSMGMSDDLEAAILEGSTIVRIGTAIFGPRQSTG
jgi:pyridoxal phosphate enzyme (YggS family)